MDKLGRWPGKGKTAKNPAKWIPEKDFFFGGKLFKAGIECKAYETANFGWTFQTVDGKVIAANE